MRRILLACSSGMSTSLLVTKMEAYAKSIGDEVEIRAVGQDQAKSELKNMDVVLIGPQMSFFKEELQQAAESHQVPVEVIDRIAYGMADGKAVYEQAVRLMGGQNE
ncbi:PTS system oligo-beta-mannoside-specific EIIB component [Kroppenstedtia guangzhouensis]|uniref:PTS system oligo-beta-mannoside-specific EIIB component n=1 Tax=Kroppenstedtia guangzhouensis TaxID=1274356 RepID=A0ABQ1GQH5_9BACL|nr:PTS sugar transporter subunit IIB [Kroppenstedtia guangzhouensis]GGA48043.1 PTS system oligo-beta-mannoside-specific EIIB component [Kroppenstedtia guangzhouensis]